jgi:peptidoglycan/LPS O-acetylase OafA/YrhL
LIALYNTGFEIISIRYFFRDIFYWLTFGLHTIQSFNGYDIIPINAGIHWTLRYEWAFYLLLPLIGFIYKSFFGKIISVLILVGVTFMPDRGYWLIFLFGILASYTAYYFPTFTWFKNQKWSALLPILGLILVYSINYKPYSYTQYFITLLVFLCFVYGNNIFGLLKLPSAKFLSTISYSVYLLHGIVLYFVLRAVHFYSPVQELSPSAFWSVILFVGLLTVLVSAMTYRYIEHPFIEKIKPIKKEIMPITVIDRVI